MKEAAEEALLPQDQARGEEGCMRKLARNLVAEALDLGHRVGRKRMPVLAVETQALAQTHVLLEIVLHDLLEVPDLVAPFEAAGVDDPDLDEDDVREVPGERARNGEQGMHSDAVEA